VRSADSGGWRPWKTALVSEVLQCASDVPGPPTQPAAQLLYTGGVAPTAADGGGGDHGDGANCAEAAAAAAAGDNAPAPAAGAAALPSIAAAWAPGAANGCPIEAHEVWWRVGRGHGSAEAGWRLLGATAATNVVAARGVVLGATYAFRARSRNRLGWSAWSPPSAEVTVFRVLPPAPPHALEDDDAAALETTTQTCRRSSSRRRRDGGAAHAAPASVALLRGSGRGYSGAAAGAGVTFLRLGWLPPPGVPPSDVDSYALEYLELKKAAGSSSSSSSPTAPSGSHSNAGSSGSAPPWRSVQELGGPGAVPGAGRPAPSLIVGGLLPGHTYAFRVKALCFAGWTDWSQPSGELSTDRRF
jgi:hypothetical protein